MSMTIAEMRADIVTCPTCATETFPSRKGTCAGCDTPLGVEPLVVVEETLTATCLYPGCEVEFELKERGKSREFCTDLHRKAYWHRYSEKGREDRERHRKQQNERRRVERARLRALGLTSRGTPPKRAA